MTSPRHAIAVLALGLALAAEAQTDSQLEAAKRYAALRGAVLNSTGPRQPAPNASDRQIIATVTVGVLRQYRNGPDWSPQHPEWRRLAPIIEADIEELLREVAKDPWLGQAGQTLDTVLVRGLATRLSVDELEQLRTYYSAPAGMRFAAVQDRLVKAFVSGMVKLQAQMMARQPIARPASPPSQESLRELLGLLDETVRMQWAFADPGPGGDRSGLQAIPLMAMAIVQTSFGEMEPIWKALPESERKAALAWRDSPLGRKEREAIFESAKEVPKVLNADAQLRRLAEGMKRYDAKWRALIQGKRE